MKTGKRDVRRRGDALLELEALVDGLPRLLCWLPRRTPGETVEIVGIRGVLWTVVAVHPGVRSNQAKSGNYLL